MSFCLHSLPLWLNTLILMTPYIMFNFNWKTIKTITIELLLSQPTKSMPKQTKVEEQPLHADPDNVIKGVTRSTYQIRALTDWCWRTASPRRPWWCHYRGQKVNLPNPCPDRLMLKNSLSTPTLMMSLQGSKGQPTKSVPGQTDVEEQPLHADPNQVITGVTRSTYQIRAPTD